MQRTHRDSERLVGLDAQLLTGDLLILRSLVGVEQHVIPGKHTGSGCKGAEAYEQRKGFHGGGPSVIIGIMVLPIV